ncbi:hypothetical protein D3C71_1790510 [compost metagenome]
MMRDEHNLNVLVFRAQEAGHPEKEAAGYVLLEGAHGTRGIHHGNNERIGVRFFDFFPCFETQIIW